jgi:hypothetical protein
MDGNFTKQMRTIESYNKHLTTAVAGCCQKYVVLKSDTLLGDEYLIAPARCKSNYCKVCRPQNLRTLRHTLLGSLKYHRWRLLTLTYPDHSKDVLTQLTSIYRQCKRLVQRIRYTYPDVAFCRTIEIHQTGYPHLHFVIDKYIPVSFIQKHWHDLGGGRVDIRMPVKRDGTKKRVSYKDVARYLTEELEKKEQDPHKLGHIFWQAQCKAITTSRNLKLKKTKSPYTYMGVHHTLASAMYHYEWLLFKWEMDGTPKPSINYGANCIKVGYGYANTHKSVRELHKANDNVASAIAPSFKLPNSFKKKA